MPILLNTNRNEITFYCERTGCSRKVTRTQKTNDRNDLGHFTGTTVRGFADLPIWWRYENGGNGPVLTCQRCADEIDYWKKHDHAEGIREIRHAKTTKEK